MQVCLFDNSSLLEKATCTVNNRDDGVFCGKMKGALALIHTIVRIGWCDKATRKIVDVLHSCIGLKTNGLQELKWIAMNIRVGGATDKVVCLVLEF